MDTDEGRPEDGTPDSPMCPTPCVDRERNSSVEFGRLGSTLPEILPLAGRGILIENLCWVGLGVGAKGSWRLVR